MNASSSIGVVNSDGVNLLAYLNSQAIFTTPQITATHSITISSLDIANNIITLSIASTPQTITLKKGETKLVDLNGDKKNDLELTFVNVYVNRAEVTARAVATTTPVVVVTPIVVTKPTTTTPVKPTTKPTTKPAKSFVFNKNLKLNNVSSDVKELQKYLNNHGYTVAKTGVSSKGKETTTFTSATKNALIKFQKANKITPASGIFGPITRKVINKIK
jgi:hypothetical protein